MQLGKKRLRRKGQFRAALSFIPGALWERWDRVEPGCCRVLVCCATIGKGHGAAGHTEYSLIEGSLSGQVWLGKYVKSSGRKVVACRKVSL